jgi:transposase
MARFVYTQKHLDFLRKYYPKMSQSDLTQAFNEHFGLDKSLSAIKTALRKNKIYCHRPKTQPLRVVTKEQAAFIREQYRHHDLQALTRLVNEHFGISLTAKQIRAFVRNHKILSGRTGHFSKGSEPWNKGKKGYMGPNQTSFKKGNRPHNTRYLGHERISKDGYVEISVAETNSHTGFHRRYKLKHVHTWEQHHGPVPAGHVVVFKNGDKTDIRLDNLMLLSRTELLIANLHGYKDAPEEIKPSILALSRVEAACGFRTQPGQGRKKEAVS